MISWQTKIDCSFFYGASTIGEPTNTLSCTPLLFLLLFFSAYIYRSTIQLLFLFFPFPSFLICSWENPFNLVRPKSLDTTSSGTLYIHTLILERLVLLQRQPLIILDTVPRLQCQPAHHHRHRHATKSAMMLYHSHQFNWKILKDHLQHVEFRFIPPKPTLLQEPAAGTWGMEEVVVTVGVNLQVFKRNGCFSVTRNGSHWILKVTSSWKERFNWMVYSLISKIAIFLVLSVYGSFLALIIFHISGSGTVSAVYCYLPCENGSPHAPPTTTLLLSISFFSTIQINHHPTSL